MSADVKLITQNCGYEVRVDGVWAGDVRELRGKWDARLPDARALNGPLNGWFDSASLAAAALAEVAP